MKISCNASVLYEDANANVYALWCICLWCMKLPQHDIVDVNATRWWCKWKFLVLQISCRKMHMWMLCMWCKCLNQYSWKFQKFIAAFSFKNRLSCLTLNFNDHHQEFFQVRSIWYFEKFNSMSLDLFSKISQFDWK